MTAARTSKAEARRRAVEAARHANEERAARDRANIKDATILLHALDKLDAIGQWKKARRAELRAQADAQLEREEAKRVGDERTAAGAAIERMRERGETLTTIATKHDLGIGIVRAMARHAPKAGKPVPRNGSHALGHDGSGTGEATAGGRGRPGHGRAAGRSGLRVTVPRHRRRQTCQTVNPSASGRSVLCRGVTLQHTRRGVRGDAAAGRISRPPACLEGSWVVAPPCRSRGAATAPIPVRSAGTFGGVRRAMVRAALNVGVGG